MGNSNNRISGFSYSSGSAWYSNDPHIQNAEEPTSSSSSSSSVESANGELSVPMPVQGEPVYAHLAESEIVNPAAPQQPPYFQNTLPSLLFSSAPVGNRQRILTNPMARDPFNEAIPQPVRSESLSVSATEPTHSSSSPISPFLLALQAICHAHAERESGVPTAQQLPQVNLSLPPSVSSRVAEPATRSESSQSVHLESDEIDDNEPGRDLKLVWSRIRTHIDFGGEPEPQTAEQISEWFDNPAHANKIQSIRILYLCNLKLRILPPQIFKLTGLTHLSLNDNNLTSLPMGIFNLIKLQDLDLSQNQLTALPIPLSEFTTRNRLWFLREVELEDNPLIFKLNDDFSKFMDSKGFGMMSRETARYQACLDYACQTSCAAFYQAFHRNANDAEIRQKFNTLSFAMQQKIRAELRDPQGDLFADGRACLVRAAVAAMRKEFQGFPKQKQEEVYRVNVLLAKLGGQDWAVRSEDWWLGKTRAYENIIRVIDAVAFVEKGATVLRSGSSTWCWIRQGNGTWSWGQPDFGLD